MPPELRRVTDIRSPRRGSRRRDIYLDGDFWRTTTAGVLRELCIAQCDEVDPEDTDARARDAEAAEARTRALRLVGYRERSRHELLDRLADDGYPHDVATTVVDDLVCSGLVDDARYAEQLARSLVEIKRLGRSRAARELAKRGVPDDLAAAALDAYAPPDEEEHRAREAAIRLTRPDDTVDRLAGRLVRRGFTSALALAAAREALPASDHGEDPA